MKKLPAIWAIFVFPFLVSCLNNSNNKGISSGRIDYKITYLNTDIDHKTLEILPRHMKLMFDEKQAINNIEGFLGFYKLDAVTNFRTRKCSTVLKVFDKHYLFKGGRDEMMCCFDPMDEMVIKETAETKYIAGFKCRKAKIFLPSSKRYFDIYYTGDIALKHPNATNPYYRIDGVLMEFELNLINLKMRFTAEKFQSFDRASQIAGIPQNSMTISRDQMTEILNKLME